MDFRLPEDKKSYAKYGIYPLFFVAILFFVSSLSNLNLVRASPDGFGNLNSDVFFYSNGGPAISTSLSDDFGTISMGSDRISLTHSSGIWGVQGDGGSVNITQLAQSSNTFQTKLTVKASSGTVSNTTVYWSSSLSFPKDVDFNSERVVESSYFKVRTDFDAYSGGPAVYLNESSGYVIAKAEHTSDVVLTLYFSAASSTPPSSTPPSSSSSVPSSDDDEGFGEDMPPLSLDPVKTITTTTVQDGIRSVPPQTQWVTPILIVSFIGVGLISLIQVKKKYLDPKPVKNKITKRFNTTTKNLKNKLKERWD